VNLGPNRALVRVRALQKCGSGINNTTVGIPAVVGHIVFVGRHEHSVGNTATKSIDFAQSSGCSSGGLADYHERFAGVLAAHPQEGSPRIPYVRGIVVRAVRILRG
jgi:hypothetical protein